MKTTNKTGKNLTNLSKNLQMQKKNNLGGEPPKLGKENSHLLFDQSHLTYGVHNDQNVGMKNESNVFLLEAGVNKIYRNSELNRSKYLMGSYKIAEKKLQKFNTTLNSLYNNNNSTTNNQNHHNGRMKIGSSQTRNEFRLGHKKKEKSHYFSYKA